MLRKQLPAIFLELILISLSSIGCIKQEYRNSNYDLKNPFIKLSTDSADIPVITETSFFDFNSKNGPEYIDDGLHGSKALHPIKLSDTMSLSSSKRIQENMFY